MQDGQWYVAALIVQSTVSGPQDYEPLADLQFKLIRASHEEEAQQLATELGRSEETSYPNKDGDTVTWRFLGVADLRRVESVDLTHGTEIYSQLFRGLPSFRVGKKQALP